MMDKIERAIASGIDNAEPCYVISVAAKMVGMHQQTLRYYERAGVIEPSRSRGNIRLYSQADIARLRQIQQLISDFGVNLAGAEVILKLRDHIERLEFELESLRQQLAAARLSATGVAGAKARKG
ncbi:MAG: heat shock protein transcriptional repressor HspR [Dehalococcoidia bacterium]